VDASIAELFKGIRGACSPGAWSRGVELVRGDAVTGVTANAEEVVCRVRVPQRVVAPTVILYPDDGEWDCNCESNADACEHVAAAVIALRRAREEGLELPSAGRSEARLVYRFRRDKGQLKLTRFVVKADGTERPIETNLAGLAAKMGGQFVVTPSHDDLAIDRALSSLGPGAMPLDVQASLLKWLCSASQVELDGAPVSVSAEALGPQGYVEEEGMGFRVVLEKNSRITELVGPGVALAGQSLHPLAHLDVTGARLENLPSTKSYGKHELSTLVTEVLPELVSRFAVEVRSKKLPKTTNSVAPRVVLEVEQVEHSLSVMATLVYGDPPLARIDSGRLIHLNGDVPIRDEEAERRLVTKLRSDLNLTPGSRVHTKGENASRMASSLDQWSGEIRGSNVKRFINDSELRPRLETDGKGFDLTFDTVDGTSLKASAEAVIQSWREGLSLVPLMDGGWARLPASWLEEHGHRVLDLLAARSDDHALKAYAKPFLADFCERLNVPVPAELGRLSEVIGQFEKIPDARLPEDLTAELRDYQRLGVSWLSFMRDTELGATLADDMGLGKTLQTLCTLRGRTLVVCPTSVVYNWAAELQRFRPGLSFSIYHGPKRSLNPPTDVTLTSYALLRLDQPQLEAIEWDTIVLDEAQTIKNPESQVAQAAYALKGKFRLTLSGTPVENRLEELWSQFHFTNRGLLGTRQEFQERYSDPINVGAPGAAQRLRERIRPFLLRRLKQEVATELPPRSNAVLYCELAEEERAVYDAIFAATQKDIVAQLREGGSVLAALESLLRLRQAACHMALIPGQSAESSAKVKRLLGSLELAAADGHKALVFSQWTALLDLVEPHLTNAGIRFVRLDGTTKDRQGVVAEFQASGGPPVMLLSLKAGGTGLNLTSADHVFLLDLWWNPAVEEQAADRAHRIGQERPVMVYRLVAKDTVEERILLLQDQKRSIAEAALGGAEQAGSLTREDLLALLEA
jgi:superfamily II DNA or RNA helicase